MKKFIYLSICVLSFLALPASTFSHGDLHDQIQNITKIIQDGPATAKLYLKRADLYRLHNNFQAALEDYNRASTLDESLPNIDYLKGRTLFEMEDFEKAKSLLDQFLSVNSDHFQARLIRARTLRKLELNKQAISDYSIIISSASRPEPDYFIELAQAYAASGTNEIHHAIKTIDEGISKLGNAVTLQLTAIDLELQIKNYNGALKRVDIISAPLKRKEKWLARRGEILEMASRLPEARKAYQDALEAIQSLPLHLRNTKTVKELRNKVETKVISFRNSVPTLQEESIK